MYEHSNHKIFEFHNRKTGSILRSIFELIVNLKYDKYTFNDYLFKRNTTVNLYEFPRGPYDPSSWNYINNRCDRSIENQLIDGKNLFPRDPQVAELNNEIIFKKKIIDQTVLAQFYTNFHF